MSKLTATSHARSGRKAFSALFTRTRYCYGAELSHSITHLDLHLATFVRTGSFSRWLTQPCLRRPWHLVSFMALVRTCRSKCKWEGPKLATTFFREWETSSGNEKLFPSGSPSNLWCAVQNVQLMKDACLQHGGLLLLGCAF